jgi:hypothetical protein
MNLLLIGFVFLNLQIVYLVLVLQVSESSFSNLKFNI